ncbi:MAG: KH domain-containing protein [Myxococcota bacterium]
MKAVVDHLVRGLVSKPDAVRLNTVEGEASVLIELSVAPEDVARVNGPEGDTLRAIRTVLSAAAGRRKAVLELIAPGASSSGEE